MAFRRQGDREWHVSVGQRNDQADTAFDLPPDARGSNRWLKSIVMCTTGVLLNKMRYMRERNSPVLEAELVVMDEAQQYGAISEVVPMSAARKCLRGWAGDTMQTAGGMDRAAATRVARKKMLERAMGLRRNSCWMHPWQLAVHLSQLARLEPAQRAEVDKVIAAKNAHDCWWV